MALVTVGACTAAAPNEASPANETTPVVAETTAAPVAPSAASAPAEPPDSRIDFAALAGTWTVVGVAVGDGVQALGADDPAYMGRQLTISADKLAWVDAADAGAATLGDVCELSATARQTGQAKDDTQYATQLAALGVTRPDPHAVECDGGSWGPEAAGGAILFPAGADLVMTWYDGAMLKLSRGR